ncbi:MAG: hypothetical protein IPO75_10270 [Betaproteobacteria bacterium]|nr:hypothetical protein [Betaproteobacteria bacterium]
MYFPARVPVQAGELEALAAHAATDDFVLLALDDDPVLGEAVGRSARQLPGDHDFAAAAQEDERFRADDDVAATDDGYLRISGVRHRRIPSARAVVLVVVGAGREQQRRQRGDECAGTHFDLLGIRPRR